jgi:hypothetical protein
MGDAIIIGGGVCSALVFWGLYLHLKPEVFWAIILVVLFILAVGA